MSNIENKHVQTKFIIQAQPGQVHGLRPDRPVKGPTKIQLENSSYDYFLDSNKEPCKSRHQLAALNTSVHSSGRRSSSFWPKNAVDFCARKI